MAGMDTSTLPWPTLVVAARTSSDALTMIERSQPGRVRRLRGLATGYLVDDPVGEARTVLWLVSGRPDELPGGTFHRAGQRLGIEARRRRARDERRRTAELTAGLDRSRPPLWGSDPTAVDSDIDELVGLLPARLRQVARLIACGATVAAACRRFRVAERSWYAAVAVIRAEHAAVVAG